MNPVQRPRPSAWPRLVQGLVDRYGAKRVWAAGLECLGYPPTWIHTQTEVDALQGALSTTNPIGVTS